MLALMSNRVILSPFPLSLLSRSVLLMSLLYARTDGASSRIKRGAQLFFGGRHFFLAARSAMVTLWWQPAQIAIKSHSGAAPIALCRS